MQATRSGPVLTTFALPLSLSLGPRSQLVVSSRRIMTCGTLRGNNEKLIAAFRHNEGGNSDCVWRKRGLSEELHRGSEKVRESRVLCGQGQLVEEQKPSHTERPYFYQPLQNVTINRLA